MSDKVYVGQNLQSFESSPAFDPVSKVVLWYDDENAYIAGDDTGRTMDIHCPWATQQMADNILKQIGGYVYRPFTGTGAMLDPAAELGDAVTVNGVYSVLGSVTTHFDSLCASDISAPGEKEIDSEYPYVGPQGREMKRKVSLGTSYYGTKITRREGLVIEKTDGERVSAKAVFNADELSFYDGYNNRVLYFDPSTGTYKFTGTLNVNDKFIVNENGNVIIKEGSISWSAVTGTGEIDQRIEDAQSTADSASSAASSARKIANTIIDGTQVISPSIVGGKITSLDQMRAECDFYIGNNMVFGLGKGADSLITFGSASRSNCFGYIYSDAATPELTIGYNANSPSIRFGASGIYFKGNVEGITARFA